MKKTTILILLLAASKATATSVDVYVDALYWHTTETADWALTLAPEPNFEKVTFNTISFDWDPGFRVGVGFTNFCDCWDAQLSYTYFRAKTTNRAKAGMIQSEFFGSKLSLIGFFQNAKIRTKIDYNIFDWEVGHILYLTECLSLRPKVGLRGGWIDQTLKSSWEKTVDIFNILLIPITATENLTNNFWGIGPQGGVNGKWFFSSCFSLVGDFSAAFMWGHWSITDQFNDSFNSNIVTKVANRNFGAFMLQGFIGLGYDICNFYFKAGYEIQDWFNMYQVFDNGTGGHNNDLILQGLTFQVRCDF